MHLVPFGEYFPLIETLALAAADALPEKKLQSLSFGRRAACRCPLGPYRLAVSICFRRHDSPGGSRVSPISDAGTSPTC